VRRLREQAELGAMKALAEELDREAALRQQRVAVEDELSAARGTTSGIESAAALVSRQAYLERVERQVAEARVRELQQSTQVEASRAQLVDAARDRQTIEKLDDRRRAAHQREQLRRESVHGDEISLLARRTGGAA
jgi:flagellar export protein FliJ